MTNNSYSRPPEAGGDGHYGVQDEEQQEDDADAKAHAVVTLILL